MHSILSKLQDELAQYKDDAMVDNDSRFIVHDEKYIYLYLKESGVLEKASYSPDLYHFMARPSCCSFSYDYKKDRVQIELLAHYKSGKRYKPTLGAFLQRWYYNQAPIDEFVQTVVGETAKKSVDHANADKHNHCQWNLSDATTRQNSQKSDMSFRIKLPYFCFIAVAPTGEYRVLWGYSDGFAHAEQQYWLCQDMDSLIGLLGAIMQMETAPVWVKQSGTPKDIWKREPGAFCASEDFPKAAQYAERLLSMDKSAFAVFTVNKA